MFEINHFQNKALSAASKYDAVFFLVVVCRRLIQDFNPEGEFSAN